jgi:hypothetical protein
MQLDMPTAPVLRVCPNFVPTPCLAMHIHLGQRIAETLVFMVWSGVAIRGYVVDYSFVGDS